MDELETQAQEELNAMLSGTNDTQDTEDQEFEEEALEETEEESIEEESEEEKEEVSEKKKTKAEKNFEKILSEKNKAKEQAKSLDSRVQELENMLADKDFYSERPQASKFKDEINSIRENNPNLTREEAFYMIAGRENLSAKPRGIIWTPKWVTAPKPLDSLSTKEQEQYLKENDILGKLLG